MGPSRLLGYPLASEDQVPVAPPGGSWASDTAMNANRAPASPAGDPPPSLAPPGSPARGPALWGVQVCSGWEASFAPATGVSQGLLCSGHSFQPSQWLHPPQGLNTQALTQWGFSM